MTVLADWKLTGNEEVVHLAGIENGINSNNINPSHVFTICGRQFNKAMVKRERVWDVLIDSKVKINNDKDRKCQPLEPIKIVEEAISKVGEIGYNLLWDNCEHFAAYCRYGIKWSEQVRNLGILVGTYWMMPYVSVTALSTLYVWKKILARKDKEKMKSRL